MWKQLSAGAWSNAVAPEMANVDVYLFFWPFNGESDADRLVKVVLTYTQSNCARRAIYKYDLPLDEKTLYDVCDGFSGENHEKLQEIARRVAESEDQEAALGRMCDGLLPASEPVTWPRFVSFVTACAVVARYCALREEHMAFVDSVLPLQETYMRKRLQKWMEANDGLSGFERAYQLTQGKHWLSGGLLFKATLFAGAMYMLVTI